MLAFEYLPDVHALQVRSVLRFGAVACSKPGVVQVDQVLQVDPSVENLPAEQARQVRSAMEEPLTDSSCPGGQVDHTLQAVPSVEYLPLAQAPQLRSEDSVGATVCS